jgi:dipeptidyl aminopeptidase/acylaminoacyl peptidase
VTIKAMLAYACVFLAATVRPQAQPAFRERRGVKQREVTVEDSIRMTRLADPGYLLGGPSTGHAANFSPDGKRFAVVLMKGDLEQNTNKYSLVIFETASVFNSPDPQPALIMASSTNRPAIRDVKWLSDNETIVFLGEQPEESPQVYAFNISNRTLLRLTNHATPIVSYDISRDGNELIFYADPPAAKGLETEETKREGIIVGSQTIPEILGGECYSYVPTVLEGEQLFVKDKEKPPNQIAVEDVILNLQPPSISPDGRYGLVRVFVRNIPPLWQGYQDPQVHGIINGRRTPGAASRLTRYMLVDITTGATSPLLDVPSFSRADGFVWAEGGRSVILSGTFLPLDIPDAAETNSRVKTRYVAEVTLPNRKIRKITDKDFQVTAWDETNKTLTLESANSPAVPAQEVYKKEKSGWEKVPARRDESASNNAIQVTLDEGMNEPPKIFVTELKTGRRSLLLDLNPQFATLQFGKVEEVIWKASDGHEVQGGLYLPPGYVKGRKYPLVIQTHGFDRSRFWIDGPWSSSFAAQPLAAKGFLVLQIGGPTDSGEDIKYVDNTQEGPYEMAAYEGAIDFLTGRGMVDPDRVGITGFSRTVYTVEYTLTHSKTRFRAATVADGIDAGYFSYIQFPNESYEHLNGGAPFGPTLQLWLKNSPSFNLDKVETPIRMEAYSPYTLLGAWEWFAGLSRLGKPVDFIYLPHGTHILVRPQDRMISQEGNLEWFAFWLNGEEDGGPAKRARYARWHRLASLQEQNSGENRLSVPEKEIGRSSAPVTGGRR